MPDLNSTLLDRLDTLDRLFEKFCFTPARREDSENLSSLSSLSKVAFWQCGEGGCASLGLFPRDRRRALRKRARDPGSRRIVRMPAIRH